MAKKAKPISPIVAKIYKAFEARAEDWRRQHLGASAIGRPCERAVWYSYRWASDPKFEGRILRLFRRGQNEEPDVIEDLLAAGFEVTGGPAPGKQWRWSDLDGHFGGSMDGAIRGLPDDPDEWHVLEIKTHNKRSFEDLQKNSCPTSKPEHYAQMQVYMHLSGMQSALYLAVCKDDDRIHVERYSYRSEYAGELMERARRIIGHTYPPPRISDRPDYYICKWCDHYEVCHQGSLPERNCRTCKSSAPIADAAWECRSGTVHSGLTRDHDGKIIISADRQKAPDCGGYEVCET